MRVRIALQRLAGVGREPLRLAHNTFALRRGLARLPLLVRRQRRLEHLVAKLEKHAKAEKATRDEIDALLVKQGLAHGQGVTCLGYDVVHNERAGRKSIDGCRLRLAGVSDLDIAFATVEGARSSFVTVRPMKGAEVAA
jgi:hypothetical protein